MKVMEIKKQKAQKSVSQKENSNFKIIKTVQKQFNVKKVNLKKKEISTDCLKKDHKKFRRNNKSRSKTQQRFKN